MSFLTAPKNRKTLTYLLGFDTTHNHTIFVDLKPTMWCNPQVNLNKLVKILNQYYGSNIKPKKINMFETSIVKVIVSEFGTRILYTKYSTWEEVSDKYTITKDMKKQWIGEFNAICSIDGLERAYIEDNKAYIRECDKNANLATKNLSDLGETTTEY